MAEVGRVEHAEERIDTWLVLVRDDGEIERRALGLVDVGDPAPVVLGAVDAEGRSTLIASLGPFGLKFGRGPQFGGAHRR